MVFKRSTLAPSTDHPYGLQVEGESQFKRRCRLLQSWYRVEVLKEERFGLHKVDGRAVGSVLVDGEASGANFLTPAALACAWEKVAEKRDINPDLTIERYRLFNNMLSSQPMCINLLADLRLHVNHVRPNATQVLRAMLAPLDVSQVTRLEIEMLPQPKAQYISDKTGLDAAVFFTDAAGQAGFASIETKYTDKLGGNKAGREEHQKRIAGEIGLLNSAGSVWYDSHHFDQIIRNLLLTIVYGRRHGMTTVKHLVWSPRDDAETSALVDGVRSRLSPAFKDSIECVALETVVECGLTVADRYFADLLRRFRQRYLDFTPIGPASL